MPRLRIGITFDFGKSSLEFVDAFVETLCVRINVVRETFGFHHKAGKASVLLLKPIELRA